MRVERGMFHKTALIIKLIACKGIEYLNVYRLSDEVNFEPAFENLNWMKRTRERRKFIGKIWQM